jgi:glycine/D-amino acid oxidase-like deaminating enzyme
VTLVDAYGPGNSRSSSGDESRILRCGYGPDEIYSRFARRALDDWRRLDERLRPGQGPIWYGCGVLWLARGDDQYAVATRQTLERGRFALEVLDAERLRTRYPQVSAGDVAPALVEPACGVLAARRAVRALVDELARGGVRVVRGRVAPPSGEGRLPAVSLDDGARIGADVFVFACGPWLPKVFPDVIGSRIRPTRQVVVYFGVPPGDDRFGPGRMPAIIDSTREVYSVPDIDDRGLKVGLDRHGAEFDPDADERVADAASIEQARAWLAMRCPDLGEAPVVETRVCQYENTATGDFLIDRHPALDNVWLVGGGSGHGFKHGPAVGEHVATAIVHGDALDPRFSLATKGVEPRRAVF